MIYGVIWSREIYKIRRNLGVFGTGPLSLYSAALNERSDAFVLR